MMPDGFIPIIPVTRMLPALYFTAMHTIFSWHVIGLVLTHSVTW